MTKPAENNKTKRSSKETRRVLMRLAGYVFRQWPMLLVAVAFTLLSNQLALMAPRYSGAAIDAMGSGVDFPTVWENVLRMVLCYVLAAALSYVLAIIMIHLSQRIVYRMRKQVFEKLGTLPVKFFDTHPVGDIISRLSYDIDTLNGSLSHDLVQVMTSIYTVVGSLYFMWQISKPMLLIFAVTVPLSLIFTRYRSQKVRPLFRERTKKLGELNGYAEEMLSGTRSIEAYGRAQVIANRFFKRNEEASEALYRAEYAASSLPPTISFISNLSLSLVATMGGALYMLSISGRVQEDALLFITLGGIAQFVQYSRKFAGPINEFANILHEFQSAFSAADRIFHILDEPTEPADVPDALPLTAVTGDVEFCDISFGYTPEKTVLRNVSLHASPGQTVAIVGPTGAGKTTVINLLMRFYDPDSGEIRMESLPTLKLRREELRRAYTMVLQDTWLFNGTIYDNIVYGRENATPDEVIAAAKAARIHGYIESLPDGYQTVLSDDGVNISKGQRQLITIARALLSDAPMLILDEATSNVDSRTEIKIQEAMNELMKHRTCFVIAHRLSTIQNADTILVVQNGTVTEQGSHEELMKRGGFYSTLYNSQFV